MPCSVRCLARRVCRLIDRSVNHSLVNAMPENRGRSLDQWFNKERRINFVDVVLIGDRSIQTAEARSDASRQFWPSEVQRPRQQKPKKSCAHRNQHEQGFGSCASSLTRSFVRQFGPRSTLKYRSKKVLKAPTNPHPTANHRQNRQNNQRPQHHPGTLVRFAMSMTMVIMAVLIMRAVRVSRVVFHIVRRSSTAISPKNVKNHSRNI